MNGFILVDKPTDWTSHDVIGKLRGLLGERRIGHVGTLDPMATGLLTIFAGRATRAAQFLEYDEKEYIADLTLGITTDTQDTTGTVLEKRECKASRPELEEALKGFLGETEQIPPMYSAVKVKGKKPYELARRGETVEREPRKIQIREIELLEEIEGGYRMRVVCGKGTYIRTLCNDIGQALGCGGAMSGLRRTRSGCFSVEDAVSIDDIEREENREKFIRPLDGLFVGLPEIRLSGHDEKRHLNGAAINVSGYLPGRCRVYGGGGDFLSVSEVKKTEDGPVLKIEKSFFEVRVSR